VPVDPVAGWYNVWAQRSLEQKIVGSSVAFIGTVQSVVDHTVYLKVDIPIRGINVDKYGVRSGVTDCDIIFVTGQRWLYARTSIFGGSVELSAMTPREFRELQSIMLRHLSQMTPEQKTEAKKLINDRSPNKKPR
jgi:hypothetical protein